MDAEFYKTLHAAGLLSDESFQRVNQKPVQPLFSVHWEMRTLLYLGVLMLSTGFGLLIYKNIDSIGHQVVLVFIALVCTVCFVYCFKYNQPFIAGKATAPTPYFDYVLLLGSISFLSFVGYLQFKYNVFGSNYGLATFIPMLVLFFIAYYFDHLGILTMAIANLALWMGLSVTPKQLLLNNDFDSTVIIYTYLLLGIMLLLAAFATQYFNFKKHFKFSYAHYGIHVTYISLLAGYFHYYDNGACVAFMIAVFLLSLALYSQAFKDKAFYFLVLIILYSYVAISSLAVRLLFLGNEIASLYFMLLFFIGTGVGLILLLINLNKKLKAA